MLVKGIEVNRFRTRGDLLPENSWYIGCLRDVVKGAL
jgi:hypothetical protein